MVESRLLLGSNLGEGNFVGNDESQASRGYGCDMKIRKFSELTLSDIYILTLLSSPPNHTPFLPLL